MTATVGSTDRSSTVKPDRQGPRRIGRVRAGTLVGIGLPALLAYVPLLLTHRGMVGADTKTYLYLDPAKLLSEVPHVWDSQIGLGTVTHQNIGYLFPMGPFYLFFEAIGVPDWVAQRLWLGTVLFAAGMGVRYLLRTLRDREAGRGRIGMGSGGVLVATLGYMLSPYLLNYSARISVLLLPWAALPWLIALVVRSLRHGGWRYPAWFAFTMLLVGGINATAVIMVGAGPLLWVLHAVWIDREVRLRDAVAAVARITLLTLLTSLWWMAGLWAEGRYGLPVIRYTETYRTVAEVSTAPEVLRGLGYWFFYGNDKLGPWVEPSVTYTTNIWVVALSYLLPIAAMVAAALVRWRYRAYFIVLVAFGAVTAIASNPWDHPSLLGSIFKEFTRTDAGLSLRSTPRAVPLVVLGTAVLLGAGVDALGRWRPRLAVPATALASVLVVLNLPPLWTGDMVADNLERPEDIPAYWLENAAYLQSRGNDTRVLEIPGAEFASYRWGNTVDPILPGLMDRPYVARELFTWGSEPSANLLNALDRRLHEDTIDPEALVPVARLLSVGDINVRSDLQFERYRIARPRPLWDLIRRTPGLGDPTTFGTPVPNIAGPEQTMVDEVELNQTPGLEEPPPVASFPVLDARGIVTTSPNARALIASADGEGLVDAASIGLLNPAQAIFYSAGLLDPDTFATVYDAGADLLVTDTNRTRSRRWGALRENTGYTERAGETPITFDPTDQRLDVFPGAGDDAATVSEQRLRDGSAVGAVVTASAYGNPITYTPDDRPVHALDGNPLTAWRVGAIDEVIGEQLFVELTEPVTTDTINLLQPINLERTRWITKAKLTFDDGESIVVDLDDSSRDEGALGQDIDLGGERTFSKLTIEVVEANIMNRPVLDGLSGVGFAEVRIPGVGVEDIIRPATDLLDRTGSSSIGHRLTLLFSRLRSNQSEPVRTDEENALRRAVTLPTARSFLYGAQARISAGIEDWRIDALLGMPDASNGGVTAMADVRLPGSLTHRASAAIDGDPATAWTSIYQEQRGHYLEYVLPAPVTFDHLDLQLVADGRHSVPTRLGIDVDGERVGVLDVPPVEDLPHVDGRPQENRAVPVRVDLPEPAAGSTVRITIEDVREIRTNDWYSNSQTVMPVSIAELGIDGLHLDPPGPMFDSDCRDDLLSVDGEPLRLRVTGSTADALARRALDAVPCGEDAEGVTLSAGEHIFRSTQGVDSGIDIDRVALASEAGGAPLPLDELPTQVPAGPTVTVDAQLAVESRGTLAGADQPYWLVMGQSFSDGWKAQVGGTDLGPPVLIDGYANGWYVDPAVLGTGDLPFTITWAPQRNVWVAIAVSAVAMVLCLALMVLGGRGPRPSRRAAAAAVDPLRPVEPQVALPWPLRRPPASARDPRARPSAVTAAVVAVVFAAAASVNITAQRAYPLAGLVIGGALYLALRNGRWRSWLGLAAAASYSLAALFVLVQQIRWDFGADFTWPIHFERVHIFGLLAIFLLFAEGVVDLVRGALLDRRVNRSEGAPGLSLGPSTSERSARSGGPAAPDPADPVAAPPARQEEHP